jgi:hypothetical protein
MDRTKGANSIARAIRERFFRTRWLGVVEEASMVSTSEGVERFTMPFVQRFGLTP